MNRFNLSHPVVPSALRLVALLMLALWGWPAVARAQTGGERPVTPAPRAPDELTLRYVFTGARVSAGVGVAVHCTNLGPDPAALRVRLYNFNAGVSYQPVNASALNPGRTFTHGFFASDGQSDLYIDDIAVPTGAIDQGYGAVFIDPPNAQVICNANLVSKAGNPPTFALSLPVQPVDSAGVPLAVGPAAQGVMLAQEPLWAVLLLAALVLTAGGVAWRLRRQI